MDRESPRGMPPNCQYFVLSPRQSLDSPTRRPGRSANRGDENANANTPSISEGKRRSPQAARLVTSRTPQVTPRAAQQPCLRPATPPRSRAGESPCRHLMSSRSLPMTPERRTMADLDDGEPSIASISVYSEIVGNESRLSRLSRRSSGRQPLSTKELEQMRVEKKRLELREMVRKNEINRRKALVAPDTPGCAPRSLRATIPREFGLSVASTPRLDKHSVSVDSEDRRRGLLTPKASPAARKPAEAKQWKPQLTIPRGPALRTDRRMSRSERRVDGEDTESEAGTEDSVMSMTQDSVSRQRSAPTPRAATPERRRLEVYAAAARAERGAAQRASGCSGGTGSAGALPGAGGGTGASEPPQAHERVVAGAAAKERARLAREVARQHKDEEALAVKDKVCLFKGTKAADRPKDAPVAAAAAALRLEKSQGDLVSERPRLLAQRRPSFGSSTARPCLK